MGNLWLKIKVWSKMVVFALLAIYVLLVVFNNRGHEVALWVWFSGSDSTHSVLVYMLFSFLAGVLGTILFRTVFGTINQIRALGHQKTQRRLADMEAKASRLQTLPPPGANSGGSAAPPAG